MRPLPFAICAAVAAATALACGEDFQLPPATAPNELDTATVYALTGTPVGAPSGYQLEFRRVVRTDQTAAFDFAFDITPAGDPVFLPTGALGLGEASGFQPAPEPFDSITAAPNSGYVYDTTATAVAGTELLVQSRVTTCSYGGTASFYAKLRVLAADAVARHVVFEILVNTNCGYRGLEPGIPTS
jgi:hypothetical protein